MATFAVNESLSTALTSTAVKDGPPELSSVVIEPVGFGGGDGVNGVIRPWPYGGTACAGRGGTGLGGEGTGG